MVRWTWLVLCVAVGCGGDGGGDADGDGDTDGGNTPIDTDLCSEIPNYDLTTLSCDQLLNAFDTTMDAAGDCNTAADCQALSGQCTAMLNECFYPVNMCVDSSTVGSFVAEYASCVDDDQCQCSGAQPVICVAGRCEFDL